MGMAAHLDGSHVTVLDQMGMAQKGGSVFSHIRLAAAAEQLHGLRVGRGEADLLLACDMVVAGAKDTLATLRNGVSHVVLNTYEVPTGDFVMDTTTRLPSAQLRRSITDAAGSDAVHQFDATSLASALMGDSIATNPFVLGYAWQRGLIPLSLDSILRAIELNGTAAQSNTTAFACGRCAAVDLKRVADAAGIVVLPPTPRTLDDLIASREKHLIAYQSGFLARRYRKTIDRVRETEARLFSGSTALTEAIARNYAKLLAYKDEYEVARLYTAPEFTAALAAQFENPEKLEFHLAPPFMARREARTGHLIKQSYGPWMMSA
jgi:indolepyruvate ferredoxin oxidoreductase